MLVEPQECLGNPVHRVLPGHLDVQEIQDKDLQDHPGPQDSQVMEDQDPRETKETQALELALEHITLDNQDHLGLLGLKDQQVLLDQGATKVNKDNKVCPAPQEAQRECRVMLEDMGSLDHRVHQGILDVQDHQESKGTLELQAPQEVQSQSLQGPLVPQVLLALLARQAPSLLLVRCASTSLTI